MNIANIYKNLKQILQESNIALVNKGGNECSTFKQLSTEIDNLEINRLPYLLGGKIIELTEDDFDGENIKEYAFSGTALVKITIPNSVTHISNEAFEYCYKLTDIYMYSTIPPTLDGTYGMNMTIHVPIGSGDAYKSATNWSNVASRIVEDIVIEYGVN